MQLLKSTAKTNPAVNKILFAPASHRILLHPHIRRSIDHNSFESLQLDHEYAS